MPEPSYFALHYLVVAKKSWCLNHHDLKSVNESIDMRGGYKRVFDLAVIIITYILLFPLWLIAWIFVPLAIWLEDRGPVFYAQERIGWRGKHFKVLKFRTMIQDAERQTGQVWAAEDDPRLTTVGKTLRRLHLDEIPQVINIVKGEMSLVGPRPERPALAEQFNREVPGFSSVSGSGRVSPDWPRCAAVTGRTRATSSSTTTCISKR